MSNIRAYSLWVVSCLATAGCWDSHELENGGATLARISTSPTHTCALRQAGLFCWGSNLRGELGTGDTEDRLDPVQTSVAGTDLAEVAAATGRTCVRRRSGTVACWGANELGELGSGTRGESLVAVEALGIDDAQQLVIEDGSTCVLRSDASVWCWGAAPGSAPETAALLPAPVPGLQHVVELRGGALGSYCARDENEAVHCWRFSEGAWPAPFEVPALAGAQRLAVTGHDEVCAIDAGSAIRCYNLDDATSFTLADSQGSVEIVASAGLQACARNQAGNWHCWYVRPGPPQPEQQPSPYSRAVEVESDVRLIELSISGYRSCALREDDAVSCASANDVPPRLSVVSGLPR